jgi:hypothetical protein
MIATLLLAGNACAQSNATPFLGQWVGVPEFSGGKIFIQSLFVESTKGLQSRIWVPSMGAFSIAAENITLNTDHMSFDVPVQGGNTVMRIECMPILGMDDELDAQFSFIKGSEAAIQQPPSNFKMRRHPILAGLTDVAKYKGTLQTPDGGFLTFLVAIGDVDDELVGTIDIPEQGIEGLILYCARSLEDPNRIRLIIPVAGDATMDLVVEGDTLKGEFTQGKFVIPLVLKKGEIDFVVAGTRRPQEPVPPYSYDRSALTVPTRAGHTLSGTLVVPRKRSAEGVPAVVFISGSGPQNRNGEVMNHRPFKVLADRLARKGIASFRYDDRGFGESTGDFSSATSLDFADDAAAALQYIGKDPRINPKRIGLVGHSEGGLIASLVGAGMAPAYSDDDLPSFLVLLAAPGVPGHEVLKEQMRQILLSEGIEASDVEAICTAQASLLDAVLAEASDEELMVKIRALQQLQFKANGIGDSMTDEQLTEIAEVGVLSMKEPWMLSFLKLDPRESLRQITMPVLAVNGTLDTQVFHLQNLNEIERVLRMIGEEPTILRMDGLNHLLQPAVTGAVSEYSRIDITMDEDLMSAIADWINGLPLEITSP